MTTDVVPILLRVPRREIAYVKFVFESYESIAVVRTLDPAAGLLVVLAVPDFLATTHRVAEALRAEGVCEVLDPPAGLTIDMLGPEPE